MTVQMIECTDPARVGIEALGWPREKDRFPASWHRDLVGSDLQWLANPQLRFEQCLRKIPSLFAWQGGQDLLVQLEVLARSVSFRRVFSLFEYVEGFHATLANEMRETFSLLPPQEKLRFARAPETAYRIARIRWEPAVSMHALCNFLNGAAALSKQGQPREGLGTARGESFWTSQATEPCTLPLIEEIIPVDFGSPNYSHAKATAADQPKDFPDYSPEEASAVLEKLGVALQSIRRVSPLAADLISQYVLVIVPFKEEIGRSGSTSQRRFPGRVLLNGIENVNIGSLSSSLIHEAMHQILYILELAGEFVINDKDIQVTSPWSGRNLALSSYFHACFIWYGLSQFWLQPEAIEVYGIDPVVRELKRPLRGFDGANPTEAIGLNSGRVRFDALKVAETLQATLFERVHILRNASGTDSRILEMLPR